MRVDNVADRNISAINVTIQIGHDNLNNIKALYPLCSTPATTYLSVPAVPVIQDWAGNPMTLAFFSQWKARQVMGYTFDTTDPVLWRFTIDMNRGELLIEFSETVDVSKLNVTAITLHERVDKMAGPRRRLTPESAVQGCLYCPPSSKYP